MSKNATIGMIVKAAIGVPDEHGEVAARLMSCLAKDHPRSTEWHQQFREVLEGRSQIVPMPLLKRRSLIALRARTQPTDPVQAFVDRPGLHVSDSFRRIILPALKPVEAVPKRIYHNDELQRPANDLTIQAELSKPYLSQWEDIISLIELYPKGALGHFLMFLEVNGKIFGVCFYWLDVSDRWIVGDWLLGGPGRWDAGYQVLSLANSQFTSG